jgi:hypothetical protein
VPPGEFDRSTLGAWAEWDTEHGILEEEPRIDEAFWFGGG